MSPIRTAVPPPARTRPGFTPDGKIDPLHKPRLRGWIHALFAPLALVGVLILMVFTPSQSTRAALMVYGMTGISLFTVSAIYHRGTWEEGPRLALKRADHTNIMLVIAGSYTPLAWLLLPRPTGILLLWLIWGGALAGVAFRMLWITAPRWLYTPIYVVLGLAALLFLPQFWNSSAAATVLIMLGGAFYIAGAVFYALKRPNFSLQWFGFHEFFHAFTVGGFLCHFAAIALAVSEHG